MNVDEYTKMFQLEDHYWWFVGRRRLALGLLQSGFKDLGVRPRIVDLGCGTGVVLRELQSWAEPVGLDMSSIALNYCQKRGLDRTVQGDGAKLPFASNSLDGIIGLDIFEHIEDDRAAFSEAARTLKPGGVLVLSVPAFTFLWGPHDVALMHFRRYRKAQVTSDLKAAGLVVDRVSYSVFFLFPIIVVWRIIEKRKKSPPTASLIAVPPLLNRLLICLQDFESGLIQRLNLPCGSSVIAVAHKPLS